MVSITTLVHIAEFIAWTLFIWIVSEFLQVQYQKKQMHKLLDKHLSAIQKRGLEFEDILGVVAGLADIVQGKKVGYTKKTSKEFGMDGIFEKSTRDRLAKMQQQEQEETKEEKKDTKEERWG